MVVVGGILAAAIMVGIAVGIHFLTRSATAIAKVEAEKPAPQPVEPNLVKWRDRVLVFTDEARSAAKMLEAGIDAPGYKKRTQAMDEAYAKMKDDAPPGFEGVTHNAKRVFFELNDAGPFVAARDESLRVGAKDVADKSLEVCKKSAANVRSWLAVIEQHPRLKAIPR